MPTEEQLVKIRAGIVEAESKLAILDKELKDADRAGVGVPAQRERYTELKDKVRKLKAVYGE